MIDNITGKNILLICFPFFGYDKAMRDELYRLGAKYVHLKEARYFAGSPIDDEFWHPVYRGIQFYFQKPNARTNWTEEFKKEIENIHFDVLLVIENTCFKKSFIPYLKSINPNIKTIWFLWDTFETQQKWHRDYIPLFDKVYTFDRDDAKKYNLEYYPDFYIDYKGGDNHKYDICFIGSAFGTKTLYRVKMTKQLQQQCDKLGLKSFFYIRYYDYPVQKNPLKKLITNIFPNEHKRVMQAYKSEPYMHENPMPLEECNNVMQNSDIIVDMNHPNRQGMTINAITAIATGKKLITTNRRIVKEEFYNPNNILIVDEQHPVIPAEFITSKVEPVNVTYLRMDNWLKHVINS